MLRFTCWVNAATAATARPARRPAALQLVGIDSLFRLVVPGWTPRGTRPDDRPPGRDSHYWTIPPTDPDVTNSVIRFLGIPGSQPRS